MNLVERFRSWLNRGAAPGGEMAADPADLNGSPPEDPAVATGLDRPFPDSGPVAESPISDPPGAEPPERPLG